MTGYIFTPCVGYLLPPSHQSNDITHLATTPLHHGVCKQPSLSKHREEISNDGTVSGHGTLRGQ